jgi:myosin heavy subunit
LQFSAEEWQLKDASYYRYLNQGNALKIDDVDDEEEFEQLRVL